MRRTIGAILLACLTLMMPTQASADYVTGNILNCRATPGSLGYIMTTFGYGTKLEVIGEAENGWKKVQADGYTCYVSPDYVSADEPPPLQPVGPSYSGEASGNSDTSTYGSSSRLFFI